MVGKVKSLTSEFHYTAALRTRALASRLSHALPVVPLLVRCTKVRTLSMPLDSDDDQSSADPPNKLTRTQVDRFPIVGIGASAGGLAAFEAFFREFPKETGVRIAFVVVQHLAPEHESNLVELLGNYTDMPVHSVVSGMPVRSNCVYVLPPNHELHIQGGALKLLPLTEPRSQRLPIDSFFSSLAEDQKHLAIAIILSGSGSDGSQGVRAIKHAGGMVMVQSPESTEFDSMPLSAIQTGVVDFVAPVSEMPERLLAYAARAYSSLSGKVVQASRTRPFRKSLCCSERVLATIFRYTSPARSTDESIVVWR